MSQAAQIMDELRDAGFFDETIELPLRRYPTVAAMLFWVGTVVSVLAEEFHLAQLLSIASAPLLAIALGSALKVRLQARRIAAFEGRSPTVGEMRSAHRTVRLSLRPGSRECRSDANG